jgi:hypothetical protein
MFDLRYHIASLAAVLIAIAIGIVIGVAIASGGAVDEARKSVQDDQIAALRKDLDAERARAGRSEQQQKAITEVMNQAYPVLMGGRLAGRGYAVLFLGPIDGGVRSAVERTLTEGGSGSPVRVTALDVPIDVQGINALLAPDPVYAGYVGDARLGDLGEALGRELAAGGSTPLWDLLANQLVEQRTGSPADPVDGVVVVSSWTPEETSDPAKEGRNSQTEALTVGLLKGLGGSGLPVVGVETSTSAQSAVEVYRQLGLSSVDDVDSLPGRLALGLLLAGGEVGNYGTKEASSDGVTPPIEPLVVTTVAG